MHKPWFGTDRACAATDFALAIHQPEPILLPTQAEQVAVLRAMRSLARKSKIVLTGGKRAKRFGWNGDDPSFAERCFFVLIDMSTRRCFSMAI